ncbi:amino acid adenylation domain-containing protein [Myxococcus sp. 1LA]
MTTRDVLAAFAEGKLSKAETRRRLAALRTASIRVPLSEGQKGLWAMQQASPESSAYNVPLAYRLRGTVDVARLLRAWEGLLERHPLLAGAIRIEGAEPVFVPSGQVSAEVHQAAPLSEAELVSSLRAASKVPFDLARGPLARLHLFSRSEHESVLLLCFHHIVLDGASVAPLLDALRERYAGTEAGAGLFEVPLVAPHRASVEWELEVMGGEEGRRHLDYWRQVLTAPVPPPLNLPTDRSRGVTGEGPEGATCSLALTAEQTSRLRELARSRQVSLPTVLLALYYALLHRYTRQDDLVVGIPTLGRNRAEVATAIGYFVNVMAVRARDLGQHTFDSLLRHLHGAVIDGLEHAHYPFPRVVKELRLSSGPSEAPGFQTMFTFQSLQLLRAPSKPESASGGLRELEPLDCVHQEGAYPLELEVVEGATNLTLHFKYDARLFEPSTVERMARQVSRVADQVAGGLDAPLGAISWLDDPERQTLLRDWNATGVPFPEDLGVHDLVQRRARETPEAVSIRYEGRSLSYRELDARSRAIANHLRNLGVGPGALVGICLERSAELVAAMLGVLSAGAAYVPLDPVHPEDRLKYMLEDSGAVVVLTSRASRDKVAGIAGATCTVLVLEELQDGPAAMEGRPAKVAPNGLAYVIYTSGSTGRPKGVMIPHGGVVNFLLCMRRMLGLKRTDSLLAVTTYCFDIAVLELLLPLCAGAQVIIATAETARNAEALKRALRTVRPTLMQATPATWTMLFQSGWENTERVRLLCGGEALPESLKAHFTRTASDVLNMFGPTETTIWSTVAKVSASRPVTIGKPIDNTQVYVLDDRMQPVPIGVPGELWIAGAGVARGYLNRPALTAERFVPNPFTPGTTLYRTGDLARWRGDGEVEYLGRLDHQVKVRGFRIEMGEIEAQLAGHASVKNCAVVAKELNGSAQLIAYCQPAGAHFDEEAIRAHLRKFLPDYMVPAHVIAVDAIPLSGNGKVDRGQLSSRPVVTRRKAAVVHAQSPVEAALVELWKQVLQVGEVGVEDRFFEVGGDSVLAAVLVEEMNRRFDTRLAVTDLFKYVHIRDMARHLEGLSAPASREPVSVPREGAASESAYAGSLAIIGISCQVPGASDHRGFWENLRDGKDSVAAHGEEALRALGVPDAVIQDPRYVAVQSTIDDKDCFDPQFFGLTARDAAFMDPQFRLLLMHAWKAVEDAALPPSRLGTCGVFMTASNSFYHQGMPQFPANGHPVLRTVDEYVLWVLAQAGSIPTMVSYKLGLKGPSLFVHTNCSSSLSALYVAQQAIAAGDCQTALVGAATVFPSANLGYLHQRGLNFSSAGRVKAFDASADGMVAGEGVAVLVVKDAAAAVRDGDPIYCLVRKVGINNDGQDKVGFYAPSATGQAEVIRRLFERTGIDPASIGYVEAHGTGTLLGDPVEVSALTEAFRAFTDRRGFCRLGSVKSNLGHLDTVAGLAGLIKTALSLRQGEVPPTLHVAEVNPKLELADSPFVIADRLSAWPSLPGPRRAAVSAFGLGGTNTHAILEQHPEASRAEEKNRPVASMRAVAPFSARTVDALKANLGALLEFLEAPVSEELSLADITYTLQVGRVAMAERMVVVASTRDELVRGLRRGLAESGELAGSVVDVLPASDAEARSLAEAWARGEAVDWDGLHGDAKPVRVSLPTYQFAKERYGLTAVAPPPSTPLPPKPDVSLFVPTWQPYQEAPGASAAAETAAPHRHLVVLCEPFASQGADVSAEFARQLSARRIEVVTTSSLSARVDERFMTHASAVFECVKKLLSERLTAPVTLQVLVPDEEEALALGGLGGFLRSAAQENPMLRPQLIRVQGSVSTVVLVDVLAKATARGTRWSCGTRRASSHGVSGVKQVPRGRTRHPSGVKVAST